tara:strand:+ start:437 stop:805 length:369 start_codon:yes stop_codon:yes gene_type:complete
MAQHRTPQEILNETLKKVHELKIKVAQSQIANDPRMKAVMGEEKEAKAELAKAMKWLDPEKGLAVRIKRLTQQLVEAESNLVNAEHIQEEMKANLESIWERKESITSDLDIDALLANMGDNS